MLRVWSSPWRSVKIFFPYIRVAMSIQRLQSFDTLRQINNNNSNSTMQQPRRQQHLIFPQFVLLIILLHQTLAKGKNDITNKHWDFGPFHNTDRLSFGKHSSHKVNKIIYSDQCFSTNFWVSELTLGRRKTYFSFICVVKFCFALKSGSPISRCWEPLI